MPKSESEMLKVAAGIAHATFMKLGKPSEFTRQKIRESLRMACERFCDPARWHRVVNGLDVLSLEGIFRIAASEHCVDLQDAYNQERWAKIVFEELDRLDVATP